MKLYLAGTAPGNDMGLSRDRTPMPLTRRLFSYYFLRIHKTFEDAKVFQWMVDKSRSREGLSRRT